MSTLTQTFGRTDFDAPRPLWRARAATACSTLDALYRERPATWRRSTTHILRDIGVTRGDVDSTLSRPEEHLRLVLLRGDDQRQR